MKKITRKIILISAITYSIQFLMLVFFLRSFKEEYQIDDVNVRVAYGEPLWLVSIPGAGIILMIIKATIKNQDVYRELSITHEYYTYKEQLQVIYVNWENVTVKSDSDKVTLIEKDDNGENVIMNFPRDSFWLGE